MTIFSCLAAVTKMILIGPFSQAIYNKQQLMLIKPIIVSFSQSEENFAGNHITILLVEKNATPRIM